MSCCSCNSCNSCNNSNDLSQLVGKTVTICVESGCGCSSEKCYTGILMSNSGRNVTLAENVRQRSGSNSGCGCSNSCSSCNSCSRCGCSSCGSCNSCRRCSSCSSCGSSNSCGCSSCGSCGSCNQSVSVERNRNLLGTVTTIPKSMITDVRVEGDSDNDCGCGSNSCGCSSCGRFDYYDDGSDFFDGCSSCN